MIPWHVELLRLTRTPRLSALLAVCAFLGLAQPVFVAYGEQIIAALGGSGPSVRLPPPTAELALSGYLGQVASIGMLLAAGVTVAGCAVDAHYPLAVYYRTRTGLVRQLLPRVVTSWAAVVVAFTVGLGCAVYETAILLEAPAGATVLRCWVAGSAYLSLVVAASALAAVVARGVLAGFATVAGTLMIGLPLLGMVPALRPWVPTPALPHITETLAGRPLTSALLGAALCLAIAVPAARRRPLPRR